MKNLEIVKNEESKIHAGAGLDVGLTFIIDMKRNELTQAGTIGTIHNGLTIGVYPQVRPTRLEYWYQSFQHTYIWCFQNQFSTQEHKHIAIAPGTER